MVKRDEFSFLPIEPGCYIFKNKSGDVLYVGKAKNLKKRVSNYFQKRDLDIKTSFLVKEIEDIDFIVTYNEVEALLLENNLIKKYYPKYNLDLKDSRRYAYIKINLGELPWIEVVRQREGEGEYYGPFVSGIIRRNLMDLLYRNFRILTRKPSPKLRKIMDKEDYLIKVNQARQILKGNADSLINNLEDKMRESSKKNYFEYALVMKRQIDALKSLKEKQMMEMTKTVDAHIINYLVLSDEVYLILFSIRRGVLEEKQEYSFSFREDFLEEFLVQYYDSAPVPQEIILPIEIDESLIEYICRKGRRRVKVIVPSRGTKKELLNLVIQNIKNSFFAGSQRMESLKEMIGLKRMPKVIECFDISHLGGTNTVASMVCFANGLPEKSKYRKFRIRQSGNDDYLAMKEVIERRYSGTLKKSMNNPDLIVVDGGLGQLNSALEVLKKLKLDIPIISLAKRLEEVYVPEKEEPLLISRKNKGLQLLQSMRDEAHRFALGYQRKLRKI